MYTCSAVHRQLADFNRNSALCLVAALKLKGASGDANTFHMRTQLKREFQGRHIDATSIDLSDEDWLRYRSAEELLDELISLAEDGRLESITWQDIAKSALLLALFVPVFPAGEVAIATRIAVAFGAGIARGGAASAAFPHASKMLRHLNELCKGKPTERRVHMLRDYADLMLLKLEAENTSRLLITAGALMLSTGVDQLTIASSPQPFLGTGRDSDLQI